MTRRLEDATEAKIGASSVFQPDPLTRKAKRRARQNDTELGSTVAATARRKKSLDCSHHWQIEAPLGPLSTGVCRHCGEERLFRNQLEWEEVSPARLTTDGRQANGKKGMPERGGNGGSPPAWRQARPMSLQRVTAGY